jgi:integral membrane sensor domain MASE1
VAYAVAGYLGLLLPAFGTSITLVWLPTGIAVAALLRWGFRLWIGVWLGAVAVNLFNGSSLPMAFGTSVGNTLGPLLAAEVVRLPIADGAVEAARSESRGAAEWRGHGTVLIVDDEEAV